MPKRSGFTLVELLVVVAIIAILASIGMVLYATFSKNARDAKRQSDLKIIQSALEDYHADQLYYPSTVNPGQPFRFGTGVSAKTYLNKVPNDPISGRNYRYDPSPTGCNNTSIKCTSYCIYADMDGVAPPSDCTTSGYDYGVTRP